MNETSIARHTSSDLFRMSTYCPYCKRQWHTPNDRGTCIRIMPPDNVTDVHDIHYRYYRRGACWQHELDNTRDELRREQERHRALLDKVDALRKAQAALNI